MLSGDGRRNRSVRPLLARPPKAERFIRLTLRSGFLGSICV